MKYVCLCYDEEMKVKAMPKTEWDAIVREVHAYDEELRKKGHLITARALQSVQMATTVAILANPAGIFPLSGRTATRNEIAYARLADKTPDIVLSKTLDKVAWKATRIVRDAEEIRRLKQQPGKDMHAVGGATLVSSLMNLGLIDELQLMVNPLILGGGKALFKDVDKRYALKLVKAKPLKSGKVGLTYSTQS